MNDAKWVYENGHLVAFNNAGRLLRAWQADVLMGVLLADLLNQKPMLSRQLLSHMCTCALRALNDCRRM